MDKKRLFSDYIFNLIRMILNIGLPVIVLPYVMNRIGPENYGIFSYTNSVVSYFCMIAVLGIPEYAARVVARERLSESLDHTVTEIFLFQFLSVSVALVSFFLFFFPFAAPEYKKAYMVLSIMIFSGYLNVEWFYVGTQKFKFMAVRGMSIKILNVAAMFLFITRGDDYFHYTLITSLTTLGNSVVNMGGFIPRIQLGKWRSLNLKRHFKPVMVLFSLSVAGLINASIDKTLTGLLVGPLYVGFYALGFRLSRIVLQLFTALNNIIYPRVTSYLARKDEAQSAKLITFNMDYIFMLSLPIVLGIVLYGQDIIRMLFDPEMAPAGTSLMILSFIVPFQAIKRLVRQQILLPRDKDKIILYITIGGIVVNVILNLFLVPRYFHMGAAVATLIMEAADVIFSLWYIKRVFNVRILKLTQLKYFLATPLILIPYYLYSIKREISLWELLVIVMVSSILYFTGLLILRDDLFYKITRKLIKKILS